MLNKLKLFPFMFLFMAGTIGRRSVRRRCTNAEIFLGQKFPIVLLYISFYMECWILMVH